MPEAVIKKNFFFRNIGIIKKSDDSI